MPRTSAAPSARTRVKRMQERRAYDRASIDAILDAQPLARSAYNFSINYRSGFKCAFFGKKKKMFRPHSRPVLIKWYIHLGSSVLTTLNSFNIRNSIFRPFIELDVILCAYKLL